MPIKIGETTVSSVYLGETLISSVYEGTTQVFTTAVAALDVVATFIGGTETATAPVSTSVVDSQVAATFAGGTETATAPVSSYDSIVQVGASFVGGTEAGATPVSTSVVDSQVSATFAGGTEVGTVPVATYSTTLPVAATFIGGTEVGTAPVVFQIQDQDVAATFTGGTETALVILSASAVDSQVAATFTGGTEAGAVTVSAGIVNAQVEATFTGGTEVGTAPVLSAATTSDLSVVATFGGGTETGFVEVTASAPATPPSWVLEGGGASQDDAYFIDSANLPSGADVSGILAGGSNSGFLSGNTYKNNGRTYFRVQVPSSENGKRLKVQLDSATPTGKNWTFCWYEELGSEDNPWSYPFDNQFPLLRGGELCDFSIHPTYSADRYPSVLSMTVTFEDQPVAVVPPPIVVPDDPPTITYNPDPATALENLEAIPSYTTGLSDPQWQYSQDSGTTWTFHNDSTRGSNLWKMKTVSGWDAGEWFRISWIRNGTREYATNHVVIELQQPALQILPAPSANPATTQLPTFMDSDDTIPGNTDGYGYLTSTQIDWWEPDTGKTTLKGKRLTWSNATLGDLGQPRDLWGTLTDEEIPLSSYHLAFMRRGAEVFSAWADVDLAEVPDGPDVDIRIGYSNITLGGSNTWAGVLHSGYGGGTDSSVPEYWTRVTVSYNIGLPDPPGLNQYVNRVSIHEWGHVLELAHTDSSTLLPTPGGQYTDTVMDGLASLVEDWKQIITYGDILGVWRIFGSNPTAAPIVPDGVQGLSVTASAGALTVSWDKPILDGGRPILGYEVHVSEGSTAPATDLLTSNQAADRVIRCQKITAKIPGTSGNVHSVQVRAINEIGNGMWNYVKTGTPNAASTTDTPLIITGLSVNTTGTISWDTPSNGGSAITKVQYRQRVSGGSWGSWTDIPNSNAGGTNATSYTLTGLTGSSLLCLDSDLYASPSVPGELWSLDRTTPGDSTEVGDLSSGVLWPTSATRHKGEVLFVAGSNVRELWLLDETTPSSSTKIGDIPVGSGSGMGFNGITSHKGELLGIGDNVSTGGTEIWLIDRDTLANSAKIGDLPSGLSSPYGFGSHNGELLVTQTGSSGGSLWLINRTTPSSSTQIGSFPSGLTSPSCLVSHGSELLAGNSLISSSELWLIDRDTPSSSTEIGDLPSGLVNSEGLASLTHYFQVRAVNAQGTGGYSTVASTTIAPAPTVTYSHGSDSITATFSSDSGITSYQWQGSVVNFGDITSSHQFVSGHSTKTLTFTNEFYFEITYGFSAYRISWVRGGITEYGPTTTRP